MERSFRQETRLEWQEKIRKQKDSGQTMALWCREQQVNYQSFLYWKKRFNSAQNTLVRSSFLELLDASEGPGVHIEYKAFRIVLEKNFNETVLIQCLQILGRVPC
jgi:hypothetical protein